MTQPQLLAELLAAPPGALPHDDAIMLIVGAGLMTQAQWRAARERLTSDVRALVGSTEAGSITLTPIEAPQDLAWHQVIPGCELQVVDEQDQPLPAGRMGAVRVRQNGVDGYLGDPATSRDFFRDGWFYPGDLGILRDDGRLSLQGRVTDVINVMGDKIGVAPIEAALQEALGAQAVCVFSAPGADGEEVHVAIHPGVPVTPDALRAALAAALPGLAQVRVHPVQGFPRNHLGKIERGTLKAQLFPAAGKS
jgi:long-chain acyl-CoA synthetase